MDTDPAECPAQPRRRTCSFYVVLFCLVLPLWSSIPLSWLFILYVLKSGKIWHFAWPGRMLFAVALSEVFFSVYHFQLSRAVSGTVPYAVGDLADIHVAIRRLLKTGLADLPGDTSNEDILQLHPDDPLAVDFRNTMRTWFRKVPWSSVKLHEVRQWLYWSIFNADMPLLESLSTSQRDILDRAVDLLQKRTGRTFQEGSNPAVQPMRVTIDDVNILWRPLTFYLAISSINFFFKKLYEFAWDTRYGHYDGLEYLIRIPTHWNPVSGPRPIVFLHGLGLGLLQYNSIIMHLLQRFSDRPLLVLLQPHISQDIFHPRYLKPMNRHETADRLAGLINELGWIYHEPHDNETEDSEEEKEIAYILNGNRRGGVTMVSHSNGSYIHAWMLKGYPSMVGRSCFVDPVTFCSWEGDVCYNFVYRPCATGIEVLMRYFVGAELGVANLIQRHFDWVSNSLWYEEIPNACDPSKTMFLLGGKDAIVHTERVKRYLMLHGVHKGIWYDPDGSHGQALLSGSSGHTEIFRWLQEEDA